MKKFCDIYVESLYSACSGYPLWNPHDKVRLGDIGFVKDGSFVTLFNAGQGPNETLSDAENMNLAIRTRSPVMDSTTSSTSNSRPTSPTTTTSFPPSVDNVGHLSLPSNPAAASNSRSPSSSPPTSRRSSIGRSLFHSNQEPLQPPLPLIMQEIQPQRFDAGPRTSSNFHCLGFNLGASLPGAPVAGTIEFETSGGQGALLCQRAPTERLALAHEGVLRKYLSQHAEWILSRYGPSEDIDQVVLVTGMENTSDWAMAISDEHSRSAKIELEVFSFGKPGVWCEWKTSCTASQRGPHRDLSRYHDRRASTTSTKSGRETTPTPDLGANLNPSTQGSSQNPSQQHAGSNGQPQSSGGAGNQAKPSGMAASLDTAMDVDADTSASFHFGLKTGEVGYQASQSEANGHGNGHGFPSLHQPEVEWSSSNPFPPTESVVLQRLTAKLNPFRGVRLKASAEPHPDPSREGEDQGSAIESKASSSRIEGQDSSSLNIKTAFDPVNLLHQFIHSRHQDVRASIVSDSDCLRLLNGCAISTSGEMTRVLLEALDKTFKIAIDENGVGSVKFSSSETAGIVNQKDLTAKSKRSVLIDTQPKSEISTKTSSISGSSSSKSSFLKHCYNPRRSAEVLGKSIRKVFIRREKENKGKGILPKRSWERDETEEEAGFKIFKEKKSTGENDQIGNDCGGNYVGIEVRS